MQHCYIFFSDGFLRLYTSTFLSDCNVEDSYKFFKETFNRVFAAPYDYYQLPGTDFTLFCGESIFAAAQKKGILRLHMPPDTSNRFSWRKITMFLSRIFGYINMFDLQPYEQIIVLIITILAAFELFKFVDIFVNAVFGHILAHVIGRLGVLLEHALNYDLQSTYNWMLLLQTTMPLPIGLAVTVLQYHLEAYLGFGSFASYLPSLAYECGRFILMKVSNLKHKKTISEINSHKKMLRLPFLAYLLKNQQMFKKEVVPQTLYWKIAGGIFDTTVIYLEPKIKRWWYALWVSDFQHLQLTCINI